MGTSQKCELVLDMNCRQLAHQFAPLGDAPFAYLSDGVRRDHTEMKGIVAAVALVFSTSSAIASIPPDIHEQCLKATDYIGCVKAQQGLNEQTSRVINQQGADVAEGNTCPAGYAYAGGGSCKEVICSDQHLTHNGVLLDAGWQKCPRAFFVLFPVNWGDDVQRAFVDPKCPSGVPSVGYNSTCAEKERWKFHPDGKRAN